jgi:hypothetical protein
MTRYGEFSGKKNDAMAKLLGMPSFIETITQG